MNAKPITSVLGPDARVEGNLTLSGDVQIHGAVEGDVSAGSVTLYPNSRVDGNIDAETIIIHGWVRGHLKARAIEVYSAGDVTGELDTERLSVEAGSRIEAKVAVRQAPAREAALALTDASAVKDAKASVGKKAKGKAPTGAVASVA